MEAPTTVQKPATTQDAVLELVIHPPAVQVMPSSSTRFLKMPPRK